MKSISLPDCQSNLAKERERRGKRKTRKCKWPTAKKIDLDPLFTSCQKCQSTFSVFVGELEATFSRERKREEGKRKKGDG